MWAAGSSHQLYTADILYGVFPLRHARHVNVVEEDYGYICICFWCMDLQYQCLQVLLAVHDARWTPRMSHRPTPHHVIHVRREFAIQLPIVHLQHIVEYLAQFLFFPVCSCDSCMKLCNGLATTIRNTNPKLEYRDPPCAVFYSATPAK